MARADRFLTIEDVFQELRARMEATGRPRPEIWTRNSYGGVGVIRNAAYVP